MADQISPLTQYGVGPVPYHIHNQMDSPKISMRDVKRFPQGTNIGQLAQYNGNQWVTVTQGASGTFLQAPHSWGNILEPFWGTGSLGAFSYSSGSQTLSAGVKSIAVFDYTSFSLTGTASLTFNQANSNGSICIIRSLGDVTITSSASPAVILDGMGGSGGLGVQGVLGSGTDGLPGGGFGNWYYFSGSIAGGAAGSTVLDTGGGGGSSFATLTPIATSTNGFLLPFAAVPGGGGGSGCNNTLDNTKVSGSGGVGGGALVILCGGTLNITSSFSAIGANGQNTVVNANGAGGGGGGGGFYFLANTIATNTATFTVSGGAGGTSSSGGSYNGVNGANGTHVVCQNQIF